MFEHVCVGFESPLDKLALLSTDLSLVQICQQLNSLYKGFKS